MKPVKSFQEFRSELNEAENLNESILGAIRKGIKKIGEFFTGVGSSFMNMLVRQKNGDLAKGVTVYPTSGDVELAKANGVNITVPKVPKLITESVDESLHEAKVRLGSTNKNISDIGINEFKDLLRDTIEAGSSAEPFLVWGAPGIGKTQIINVIAKEYFGPDAKDERRIIDYDLMTMNPEDFFLPNEAKDKEGKPTGKSTRMPDETLPVYKIGDKDGDARVNGPDGKGGILFLDELARAGSVQNVCLKFIEEKKLGDWVLGSKWVIVAAANREQDDETGTFRFNTTLGSRFGLQVNFVPTFEEWEAWASGRDEKGEPIINPEILAFLRFNNAEYWYDLDTEDGGGMVNTIFASPRTWKKASNVIANRAARRKAQGKEITTDEIELLASGAVGKKAAKALSGFIDLMKKVNPADIKYVYSDPDKAPIVKNLAVDEKNAFFAAVIFSTRDKKLTDKELDNFTKWLIRLNDQPWAIKGAGMIKEIHPELGDPTSHWVEVCIEKLMDAYPGIFGGR